VQHCLWVSNSEETPIVLCVEPWANELLISKGDDYLIVFDGPEGESPAVKWSKDRVTVHGWSGSVARVLLRGQIILSCLQRVPKVPRAFRT
jgi:hypothetical protein